MYRIKSWLFNIDWCDFKCAIRLFCINTWNWNKFYFVIHEWRDNTILITMSTMCHLNWWPIGDRGLKCLFSEATLFANFRPRGLYQAKVRCISAEAFASERWISCKLYCHRTFCLIKAAWPKICKKSVFVILLYLLLPYGGTISTMFVFRSA